jgi:type II secretion system protein N
MMRRATLIGLCLAAGFILACVALLTFHPYARVERLAGNALKRYAPAGTTIDTLDVSFPSDIVLTNVSIPVRVNDRQRHLPVGRLSGRLSILPLLRGKIEAEMTGDFFGGLLWLNVRFDALPHGSSNDPRFAALQARARRLDIAKLCDFFQTPVVASGRCDADVEAELDERSPTDLKGWTLVKGEQLEIPRIALEKLVLPPNREAGFSARLSAKDRKVFIEKFQLVGTAYDLSGKGVIRLSEPFEDSPIDCSFSAMLKEHVSITDERLARNGAEHVVGTLVATGGKVFLRVTGTLEKPEAQLDAASSLGSILEQLAR